MKNSIIKIDKIKKNFEGVAALDGISFEVEKGQIFGLLGPFFLFVFTHLILHFLSSQKPKIGQQSCVIKIIFQKSCDILDKW